MDFLGIVEGISANSALAAIVGAGSIIALVGFCMWGVHKVATFFDEDDVANGDEGDMFACLSCGYTMDYDTAVASSNSGHCTKCGDPV